MFKPKNAFTLVELIIVIAIIGILATAILISVASFRPKAVDANVKSAMAQVQKEIVRCVAEGYKPGLKRNGTIPVIGEGTCYQDRTWAKQIAGYMNFPDLSKIGTGTCDNAWNYINPTQIYRSDTGTFRFTARCAATVGAGTATTFTCNEQGCK